MIKGKYLGVENDQCSQVNYSVSYDVLTSVRVVKANASIPTPYTRAYIIII